jgi:hypothetical protein
MFVEVFNSMIKGIHLSLEVKTFFGNSTSATASMESSSQSPNFPLMAVNDIVERGRERSPTHNSYKVKLK